MQRISLSKVFLYISVLLCSTLSFGQEDDEDEEGDIDTERLIIVKPYSPTVSDAFKVKQQPQLNDSTENKKKQVSYDIFSFPVASTFTPAKGRATGVTAMPQPRLYNNYAALGLGNYGNILAEFYGGLMLDRSKELGISLRHNSAQGGIENVELEDGYYDTALDLDLNGTARNFTWTTNLGVQHQVYNWYGAPDFLPITEDEFNSIDPQHSYIAVALGGGIDVENSVFDKAEINYRRFGDNYGSGENHVLLSPEFEFNVLNETINLNFSADFVNGSFEQEYLEPLQNNDAGINYSFLNLGVHPSINYTSGDLALNAGAQLVYSMDGEGEESDLFIYPKLTASYRVAGEYFSLYAGAEGELQQNTYYSLAQQNPFLSPTLFIAPTDRQYDLYVGGKGKFTDNLSYDFRGTYRSEKAKALFVHNPYLPNADLDNFEYYNSFSLFYDNVNTAEFFGELQLAVSSQLNVRANATLSSYDTEFSEEAWNLPNLQGSLLADYQITDKWKAGAGLYFVGERKDFYDYTSANGNVTQRIEELGAYLDANLMVSYQLNEQLSFFARGNNLAEGNYQRWIGYPVQGIQVMGGATYQFDW